MNARPDPLLDMLAPKIVPAWNTLEARYGRELSAPEKNYLFARFILGLTTPFYGEGAPAAHLAACRSLLERVLQPADAAQALETVPQPSMAWVANAFEAIEQIGLKGGRNLREQPADPVSTQKNANHGASIDRAASGGRSA